MNVDAWLEACVAAVRAVLPDPVALPHFYQELGYIECEEDRVFSELVGQRFPVIPAYERWLKEPDFSLDRPFDLVAYVDPGPRAGEMVAEYVRLGWRPYYVLESIAADLGLDVEGPGAEIYAASLNMMVKLPPLVMADVERSLFEALSEEADESEYLDLLRAVEALSAE